MNDEFYRPTYTSGDNDAHRAFNATQVRLYGIPGLSDKDPPQDGERRPPRERVPLAKLYTGRTENLSLVLKSAAALSEDKLKPFMDVFGANIQQTDHAYVFVKAIMNKYLIMLGALTTDDIKADEPKLTAGIIFGYAYEGHTYQLPKPKIMLIPADPRPIPDDDSGYNRKGNEGYRVWLVDKLDQCVEIEISQGFIEQLVLDANLPGKRSPSMYAGRMMLSHRSGKMME
jgi:hypothetical protein